jgi:hypothetical protein
VTRAAHPLRPAGQRPSGVGGLPLHRAAAIRHQRSSSS